MASLLQQLAGTEDPRFLYMVRSLETASGNTAQDARLIADSAARFRKIMIDLRLDPKDTLGREIYGALLSRIEQDNRKLLELFGVRSSDATAVLEAAAKAGRAADIPKNCWAIKRAVAKKLIKNLPPKELMKCLKYRSVDSLLKHERIETIYVLMRLTEPEAWIRAFNRQYEQVKPNEFELRKLTIFALSQKNYSKQAGTFYRRKGHSVIHNKEIGAVGVVVPDNPDTHGLPLQTMLYLLHYINEVRLYSAYLKLRQVRPDFGRCVSEALSFDTGAVVSLAGNDVHWRTLFRAFSTSSAAAKRFQPYIDQDDLVWQSVTEQLKVVDKQFGFWAKSEIAGSMFDGKLLSGNIFDVSAAYSKSLPYSKARSSALHEAVKADLMTRYASTVRLKDVALAQLDA